MVIPISNRNSYNGYINVYYWDDDYPLLYSNEKTLCCLGWSPSYTWELWAPRNGRKETGTWGYNPTYRGPSCLGCIGDYTTALNGDYFWIPIKQPGFNGK